MLIPEPWARTVIGIHGAAGEAWLTELPGLAADCARAWGLRSVGAPFAPLSMNWVAPAVRQADTAPVVLKLGVPCRELSCEIAALSHYAGRGAVRLFAADENRGALLLARVAPGDTLFSRFGAASDEAATRIAAQTMRRLWRPVPLGTGASFPTIAEWGNGFERLRARFGGGTGPLPVCLVEQAKRLFDDLGASPHGPPVLLHGDLHHFNILASGENESDWLAIDPKGVIGDAAYEAGAFLRNPLPELLTGNDPAGVLARRVAIFADDWGVDAARVRGWGMAQAMLSAWWTIEDGDADGWKPVIQCAELLSQGV